MLVDLVLTAFNPCGGYLFVCTSSKPFAPLICQSVFTSQSHFLFVHQSVSRLVCQSLDRRSRRSKSCASRRAVDHTTRSELVQPDQTIQSVCQDSVCIWLKSYTAADTHTGPSVCLSCASFYAPLLSTHSILFHLFSGFLMCRLNVFKCPSSVCIFVVQLPSRLVFFHLPPVSDLTFALLMLESAFKKFFGFLGDKSHRHSLHYRNTDTSTITTTTTTSSTTHATTTSISVASISTFTINRNETNFTIRFAVCRCIVTTCTHLLYGASLPGSFLLISMI